jgi:hypothetical protein
VQGNSVAENQLLGTPETLRPTPSIWLLAPEQARFGFGPPDDLQERFPQYRVGPLRLEVLHRPAGTFNCQNARLTEAGSVISPANSSGRCRHAVAKYDPSG